MKGLLLLSGGIDSPVAGWIMADKGVEMNALHLSAGKDEKVKNLGKVAGIKKIFFVPHGISMSEFAEKGCEKRYTCIYCKRMMLRIAETIAEKEGCDFIVTGENLGQVASQTLDNMFVEDSAVNMPIIRPLLVKDKTETIEIAKKIGTFELSIQEQGECCWLPGQVATKADLAAVEKEEEKVDIDKLIKESLKDIRIEDVS